MIFRIVSATCASFICLVLGLFVYCQGRTKSVNKNFFFSNIALSLWAIGDILVYLANSHGNHSLALLFDRFSYFGAIGLIPFFTLLIFALTNYPASYVQSVIQKSLFYICGALLFLSFTPLIVKDVKFNPFDEVPGFLFPVLMIYFVGGLGFGITRLFMAYRHAHGITKNQIKYFGIAVMVGLVGAILYFASTFYSGFPPVYYYLEMAYAFIVAYAILAHRLMDISVIIRKTITYSLVTGTLTVIYLCTVALFTRISQGLAGYQTIFSSAIAATLITVFFQPLRKRVQTFVDTKFFRQQVDREEKLYELSREVITHTTPEAMGNALMRVLVESFHPKQAALYLRKKDGSGFGLVDSRGEPEPPKMMVEDNAMAKYFANHPQPFVQDAMDLAAESRSTRKVPHVERP